jgi:hypothetical protein
VLIEVNCRAQTFNEKSPTDTCILKDIKLKKVLADTINSVTILVNYRDFMESFIPLWRKFKVGVKSLDRGREKASYLYR